jgi:Protein of unknown function (DUF3800)
MLGNEKYPNGIYNFIPLSRISPFNLPNEKRLHMAIAAYYDSSGKIDDPNARFLVLAGFAAPDSVWPHFEVKWGAVLRKYGVDYSHMKELTQLDEQFSPERGWSKAHRQAFILALMNVWGEFVDTRLQAYSCCIALDDYRRIKEENPSLKEKKAKEVCLNCCVDCCVGGLHIAQEDFDVPRPISLYFDENESFLDRIMRVYNSKKGAKAKRRRQGWPYQVASITVASARDVYPLQAADLLAWGVHRHYVSASQDGYVEGEELYEMSLLMGQRASYFGYEQLKEEYKKQEMRRAKG